MSGSDNEKKEELGTGIRTLIGSEANTHYLRALPQFRVEPELPADLRSLLKAIDRVAPKPTRQRH
jgi:hypothetical protein